MKQLTIREDGNEVFVLSLHEDLNGFSLDIERGYSHYCEHAEYFSKLLETIGNIIEDVNLVLDDTPAYTLMTLCLKEEQLPLAKKIRTTLLDKFPEEIEQISIVGNNLNILDFFYEFNN